MIRVAYFDEHGRALLLVEAMSEPVPKAPDAAVYSAEVSAADINSIYMDLGTGLVATKTPFPVITSRNKIDGIPQGTQVFIGNYWETVEDGEIEFSADVEDLIPVSLMHDHHIDMTVEVETGP